MHIILVVNINYWQTLCRNVSVLVSSRTKIPIYLGSRLGLGLKGLVPISDICIIHLRLSYTDHRDQYRRFVFEAANARSPGTVNFQYVNLRRR